jgi:hypothetical protein
MFPPFGPFGRNSPTYCLGENPFETVSGRISPKWTKWGNIPKSKLLVEFFLPMGNVIYINNECQWLDEAKLIANDDDNAYVT